MDKLASIRAFTKVVQHNGFAQLRETCDCLAQP